MISKILLFISGGMLTLGGYFGLVAPKAPLIIDAPILNEAQRLQVRLMIEEMVDTRLQAIPNRDVFGAPVEPVAGATFNLSGSGVAASTSVITLQSLTIPQTGQVLVDADFSDTFYLTLEPGSRSRQEIVSCTTVVQNSGGTATLSGCSRGLSPIPPYTASTTLRFAHGGGTQVIFSDPPQLFEQFVAGENDETIIGLFNFNTSPVIGTATNTYQAATRLYVDNTAFSGAGTSSFVGGGLVQLAKNEQLALGTASSSVTDGRPLVLAALYSTSTPGANIVLVGGAGEYFIPITETDGKLNQTFLDLSEDFEFTSAVMTFNNASTTINNATTTILSQRLVIGTSTPNPRFVGVTIASSTYIDNGGLGVGRATTTDNNVEIAGDILILGNILARFYGNNIISTSTTVGALTATDGAATPITATCPGGKWAISGASKFESGSPAKYALTSLGPTASTTWRAEYVCIGGGSGCATSQNVRVIVYCIQP